ncbi:MAG: hypothetical protein VYD57_11395 [Pseudomonadota bacterium]|nr:hypothetical protein [Pseudomonadota bacterium]
MNGGGGSSNGNIAAFQAGRHEVLWILSVGANDFGKHRLAFGNRSICHDRLEALRERSATIGSVLDDLLVEPCRNIVVLHIFHKVQTVCFADCVLAIHSDNLNDGGKTSEWTHGRKIDCGKRRHWRPFRSREDDHCENGHQSEMEPHSRDDRKSIDADETENASVDRTGAKNDPRYLPARHSAASRIGFVPASSATA